MEKYFYTEKNALKSQTDRLFADLFKQTKLSHF